MFLLSSGEEILVAGAELVGGLLARLLAAKGIIVNTQDKREIWKQLQDASIYSSFIVVHRTGWHDKAYVTLTKVYGKHQMRIILRESE